MSSALSIALSTTFRIFVLSLANGDDVLTGTLLGCWDGAFIHQAWIEDRALEPLTLLQIVAGTCFDISYCASATLIVFFALGSILGALLSDTGLLRSAASLGRSKRAASDRVLDDIADAFSDLLPAIGEVGYESDSSYSSSVTVKISDRRNIQRPPTGTRPSTRLSSSSHLTGITSKSAHTRSLSSLTPLIIPEKRRNGLPILTVGSSDAGESTPKAKNVPPIPQSWLPASGTFIPRAYSMSSTRSDKAQSHRHRVQSTYGEDGEEEIILHSIISEDDLPPRSSFVRPRDFARGSPVEFASVDSDVPEILVVPPDSPLPVLSPGVGYEMPQSPSKSDHHKNSPTRSPVGITQMNSPIRDIRPPSRPRSPIPAQEEARHPPSPAKTIISVQEIHDDVGVPVETIISIVPVLAQDSKIEEAGETLGRSLEHLDTRDDEPISWADYVSDVTAPESTVAPAPKESLLVKAEEYRQLALQALEKKSQLQEQKVKADIEQRWADVFSLKFQIEEQEELANKLNAKARRRYHAAHNSVPIADTIDVHGLNREEATRQVDLKLRQVLINGGKHLRVIVGRGSHSKGGRPVLKPAVNEHMTKQGFKVLPDRNPGLLHVYLP